MVNYLKTHVMYLIVIGLALLGGRVWLQEHDARLRAELAIKPLQDQVATLQQQIRSNDQQAAVSKAKVVQVVQAIKTTAQAIAQIPSLSGVELHPRPAISTDTVGITVDALPLARELGQCKQDQIDLGACRLNYAACQQISDQKDQILKLATKKPSFWKRLYGQVKEVTIVGAVAFVAGKIL